MKEKLQLRVSQNEDFVAMWVSGEDEPRWWAAKLEVHNPIRHGEAFAHTFGLGPCDVSVLDSEHAKRWRLTLDKRERARRKQARASAPQPQLLPGIAELEEQGKQAHVAYRRRAAS